jgi:hypothetical protein
VVVLLPVFLHQWTMVRHSATSVAAAAVAAAAAMAAAMAVVDNEDGVQWWWKMRMAFNGSGSIQWQRWWRLR